MVCASDFNDHSVYIPVMRLLGLGFMFEILLPSLLLRMRSAKLKMTQVSNSKGRVGWRV